MTEDNGELSVEESYLKRTLLGMFASTTEETWRLYPEVSDLLLTTVEQTSGVRRFKLVLFRLQRFLLSAGQGFFLRLLRLEVFKHRAEVTALELFDLCTIALLTSLVYS